MGLDLGLGLAIGDSFMKKLDLAERSGGFDCSEESCGSSLSSYDDCHSEDENYGRKRKRARLDEADEADSNATGFPRTLPLLIWNRKPCDDDDDADAASSQQVQECHPLSFSRNGTEGDYLVGWPPIKSQRKQRCGKNRNVVVDAEKYGVGDGDGVGHSRYVKVQMEGVVITRKISLSFLHRHQSYDALTRSLIGLFGKDDVNGCTLAYQDKEGDWMLAGDLPWRTFIRSIQRLKLLKEDRIRTNSYHF